MRRLLKAALVTVVVVLPLALSNTQVRASLCGYFLDIIEFQSITGGAGLDYDDTSDLLIASVNGPVGLPNNFSAIDPDSPGSSSAYSAAAAMPGLIKLTTIKTGTCQAGFVAGDVYAGNGFPGQVVKISGAGAVVQNPWVVLPGEPEQVTGLYQDRHCSLGGDLVVVTGGVTGGSVWRIDSTGAATLVVTLPKRLEGVAVLPNITQLYGPLAGRIVTGDEDHVLPLTNGPNGKLFAIDGTGDVFTVGAGADTPGYTNYPVFNLTDPSATRFNPQDIDIVPVPDGTPGSGQFFGIDAGTGRLLTADIGTANDGLNGCECGPLLLTQEVPTEFFGLPGSGLFILKWTGVGFELEFVELFDPFTGPARWRDVTFRGGGSCRTCTGVIGDYVWKDLDEDGIQDANEQGIAGVKVTLTQPSTPGYSQTTLTDADGKYQFSGLCLGTYVVTVTLPDGDTFTITNAGGDTALDSNPNGSSVTLATDNASDLTIDFGLKGPGRIGNFVWHDINADGVQDGGEPGIGGVTVHLKVGHDNIGGPDLLTAVTTAGGAYLFTNLNPGDYTVLVDPPAGYSVSPTNVGTPATDSNPNPSNVTLTLASPVDETVDFGYFLPPEFGRIIVNKVTVPSSDTTTSFPFTTTGTGYNGFPLTGGGSNDSGDLVPGVYGVTEQLPVGWTLTSATCTNGETPAAISLEANETVICTFTNTKKAALGNYVWLDNDADGQQDGGEPGVANVAVQLFQGITLVASTVTDGTGLYLFPNLDPSTYTVKFVLPFNHTFTLHNTGSDVTDSDADNLTGMSQAVTLAPGEVNLTVDAGLKYTPPGGLGTCVPTVLSLTGNSSTTGTAGNIRTFTSTSLSVKASAWSRRDSDGAWHAAYLGAYASGLGVTDTSESGAGDTHTVDNMGGRNNYILFEFNAPVLIDQAFLDYVGADSDISVWVGTKVDPFNNHLALSDALLGTLATEQNETTSADARWANVNGANTIGNVVIIAATNGDATPEDSFKLSKLDIECVAPPPPVCIPATFTFSGSSATSGTAGNIRTFSASGTSVNVSAFSRKNADGVWNTAFLGNYAPGLGVTDGSEGTGADSSHKVDNNGSRDNYVLFEFSQPVYVDKAYLTYIAGDSDLQAWVGTKTDPFVSHQTLSDSFLASLTGEINAGTAASTTRWAEINNLSAQGNVLVIAAKTDEAGDEFKINKLAIQCAPTVNYTTFTQGGWGAPPSGNNPGAKLAKNFLTVYPAAFVQIGGTKYAKFTSAKAIQNYLPAGGTPGRLAATVTNPLTTAAGVLAGQVLALKLNVDFSNKAITQAGLASLRVKAGLPLAGQTVTQVLAVANAVLGGAALPSGVSLSQLNELVDGINNNFDNGTVNNGVLVN